MIELIPGPFGQTIVANNALNDYAWAFVLFAAALVGFLVLQKLIVWWLGVLARRTTNDIDDTAIKVVDNIRPPVYFVVAIYAGLRTLTLSEVAVGVVNGVLIAMLVYQVILSLQILIDYVIRRKLGVRDGDEGDAAVDRQSEAALDIINRLAKAALWIVGVLFVLSNFGINVTSLIASLGIGGIAIALAMQNILGDLFSSLAIYMDKPFAIGDTIKTKDVVGSVQHIGIKTTRIKALRGEEVVLSNKDLTSEKIQNFSRLEERRVAFDVGVTYDTNGEELAQIPTLVEQAITSVDDVRFGRCHWREFGDSALVFEVVFHVEDSNYARYMDVRQEINQNILRALSGAGIEFAYPTRTVHVKQAV